MNMPQRLKKKQKTCCTLYFVCRSCGYDGVPPWVQKGKGWLYCHAVFLSTYSRESRHFFPSTPFQLSKGNLINPQINLRFYIIANIFSININFIFEKSHQIHFFSNNSDKKDAEIQTPRTISQQWKIKSFSRLENGSFSSCSISSAWRSPSVPCSSETEGHNWPWAQTVRWARTIQPCIISLSQQSKETLTEIKGREGTVLKGWCLRKCRMWVDGTRHKWKKHFLNVLFIHPISSRCVIEGRTKKKTNINQPKLLITRAK